MFDKIIYKLLNTIVRWCESYKEYRIKRSLPKACYDEKARSAEVEKWVSQLEQKKIHHKKSGLMATTSGNQV